MPSGGNREQKTENTNCMIMYQHLLLFEKRQLNDAKVECTGKMGGGGGKRVVKLGEAEGNSMHRGDDKHAISSNIQ